jgi:hypothetical protein
MQTLAVHVGARVASEARGWHIRPTNLAVLERITEGCVVGLRALSHWFVYRDRGWRTSGSRRRSRKLGQLLKSSSLRLGRCMNRNLRLPENRSGAARWRSSRNRPLCLDRYRRHASTRRRTHTEFLPHVRSGCQSIQLNWWEASRSLSSHVLEESLTLGDAMPRALLLASTALGLTSRIFIPVRRSLTTVVVRGARCHSSWRVSSPGGRTVGSLVRLPGITELPVQWLGGTDGPRSQRLAGRLRR